MTSYDEIIKELKKAGLDAASGDSDESTIIVWDSNKAEIQDALDGLHFKIIGTGYDNGILIAPKE